mgnify:CR=1 FL=1
MGTFKDLSNKTFGRLTVLCRSENKRRRVYWLCSCSCGNQARVDSFALASGRTQSCGCIWLETVAGHNRTHGRSKDYLYRIWGLMIQRCENPNNPAYDRYGSRGICVCRQWRKSFTAFVSDVGERPSSSHTLDRIDNNGDYEPDNVRWATEKQQANNRRSTVFIKYNGVSKTASEWAEVTGISSKNIRQRLQKYKWTVKRALTTPDSR